MIAPPLLRAYRATAYTVGDATVRIGRRNPAMDAILQRLGARSAVLVTAWNPRSRRMPPGWNVRMQRRLAEHVRRLPTLPAAGTLRRWREAHLLVAADPRRIGQLAHRYRQNGIVVVAPHRPARLILLGDDRCGIHDGRNGTVPTCPAPGRPLHKTFPR